MKTTRLLTGVLLVHGFLLAWSGCRHSPVFCEIGCLPSGLSHLELGRFDLYHVNPPLVRTVAAAPAALAGAKTDWHLYNPNPLSRPWLSLGLDFFRINGPQSFLYCTWGRWMCIPFSLLGGYVCFRWARELYGDAAGLMAAMLWCFCPYVLGHASLMTPDAHAAAVALVAGYMFWHWLRKPSWERAFIAGLALGLAELSKFTLLVFYPLWFAMWLLYRMPERRNMDGRQWLRETAQFLALTALSVLVINAGYGFAGSFQRLGDYRFHTQWLADAASLADVPTDGANRFEGTWLGALPVPLPKDFVQGIDAQKRDFERGFPSYLRGECKAGGWWYYYLYALAVKIPLGTWALFLLAIFVSFFASRRYSAAWRDEMLLLLPAITILVLVSSQTGFNTHTRYVLPMLPLVYIWISKIGRGISLQHQKTASFVVVLLLGSVGSSLWCYPHSLSYFNEAVGGPRNGHDHLLDSNIAWGQDLFYLKDWLDAHPEASPLRLATFGWVDPRLAGMEFTLPPLGPESRPAEMIKDDSLGPRPGWYAIDVNHLHCTKIAVVDERGETRCLTNENLNYRYFRHFTPVASAGYSLCLYHVTEDEANRVRKELGLPQLPPAARQHGFSNAIPSAP